MAHDVTKQVTIEKTNVNGAVAATTTTANGKVETQVLKD
jgi:K(+)-stimulated pyrophosphate-energized sodium pump